MENELGIIDGLTSIGYAGNCLNSNILQEALTGAIKSENFRELIKWLTYELNVVCKTDERVSKDSDGDDLLMELSSLLKELGCPYAQLVTGPLNTRFQTKETNMLLVNFLIAELMAEQMVQTIYQEEDTYVISQHESNTAHSLVTITNELNLGKPPENILPKPFFEKLAFTLTDLCKKINPKKLSEPLLVLKEPLTDEQWQILEEIRKEFDMEYNMRRKVLLTRLEVTIQSFQWSEKAKSGEDEIAKKYQNNLKELEDLRFGGKETDIPALLSARVDLAIMEKTSSANVRKNTGTKLQKHIMGTVPDRGGRAYEQAPPPPEMPSWQTQRSSGPSGGRGGHGRGSSGRGSGGGHSGYGGRGNRGGNQNWAHYSNQGNSNGHGNEQQNYRQSADRPSRNENWVQNSGRVQGGWSQSQRDVDRDSYNQRGNRNDYKSGGAAGSGSGSSGNVGGGGGGDHSYRSSGPGGQGNFNNDGDNSHSQKFNNYNRGEQRGRSNYYRGRGRGGRGGGSNDYNNRR